VNIDPLYVNPHIARKREPTAYENQLADAMEQAFAAGAWELDALVAHLNAAGVHDAQQQAWTAQSFQAELKVMSQDGDSKP
jgi:hypothetical protein